MRRVVLYMAISADGYIATSDDKTPWSDESWATFQRFCRSCDVCIVGRKTFEIMKNSDELSEGVKYLVASTDELFDAVDVEKVSIDSRSDMPMEDVVGIIGGGDLNGRLAKLGVIDEIILDIEPTVLGSGKRLFGAHTTELKLDLVSSMKLGKSTVQNHYRVLL